MLFTIIASLVISQGGGLSCPITGENAPATGPAVDYNGVRYTMCCAGCNGDFKKDPAKALKGESIKNKTVGVSLFDPVTGVRLDPKDAKGGSSDFNGVRYYFAAPTAKATFDAKPKDYAKVPTKEALFCPVMGHEVESYAAAGGYVDVDTTRFYVCCGGCMEPMKKDAATLAAKAKDKLKDPKAVDAPKKEGS